MTPIVVGIALSLYSYNVSVSERALKIYEHFNGDCLTLAELTRIMELEPGNILTALPYPSAKIYVTHALARYGGEASKRYELNERV